MKSKRLAVQLIAVASLSVLLATGLGRAESATQGTDPRAIMDKMYRSMTDGRRSWHMEMRISDGGGHERIRDVLVQSLRAGDTRKSLLLIEGPAESRGSGFVTIEYDDPSKNGERWLFLPSVGRATRIATNQMSSAFMGSDFSYGDLSQPSPQLFEFKLESPAVTVDGEDCWLIAATPKLAETQSELGYKQLQIWVSKSKLVTVRIRAELSSEQKAKFIKASDFRKVGDYWVAYRMEARTVSNGKVLSQTALLSRDVKTADSSVTDTSFTKRRLEQGL
jgi:hypothetical protein